MQSNTGLEDHETWRSKINNALKDLRDHERTVSAMRPTAQRAAEDETGSAHE